MSDKGFTLMEMLFVLFTISMLALLFPFVKVSKQIQFQYDVYTVKSWIQQTQLDAMRDHQRKLIVISNRLETPDKTLFFPSGMKCNTARVGFYENGMVEHAQTITCSCEGKQKQIVIELGSGCMYVR